MHPENKKGWMEDAAHMTRKPSEDDMADNSSSRKRPLLHPIAFRRRLRYFVRESSVATSSAMEATALSFEARKMDTVGPWQG